MYPALQLFNPEEVKPDSSTVRALIDYYTKVVRYYTILFDLLAPETNWSTPNEIIYENQTLCLRHFPNREDPKARRPVLILPPQAGHHSNIADYSPAQSLVRVFHRYGYDVYVAQWLSATMEYKDLDIGDYIRLTDEAVETIREKTGIFRINLVGQCQGGWQAAVYTALHQEKISALITAAAPIDVEAEPSPIVDNAKMPLFFFQNLVAMGNGLMDGKLMLMGFKNMQPEEHYFNKYFRLWKWVLEEDEENIKRYIRFENWYEYTQMLPGRFYLEIIENIFQKNNLTKPNAMKINGQFLDLKNIDCPVIILAGAKDHITPPGQAFSLKQCVSTPEENVIEILTGGGHIGTLMGTESLREDWSKVNEVLKLII